MWAFTIANHGRSRVQPEVPVSLAHRSQVVCRRLAREWKAPIEVNEYQNSLRLGVLMRATLEIMLCNCFRFATSTLCFGRAWRNEDGLFLSNAGNAKQVLRVHHTSCSTVQLLQGHERSTGEIRVLKWLCGGLNGSPNRR